MIRDIKKGEKTSNIISLNRFPFGCFISELKTFKKKTRHLT